MCGRVKPGECQEGHQTQRYTQTLQEMAQVFAEAVACLVRERDDQFLQRIAVDYSLDLEELRTKYLAVAEAAIKVPRKYKKREPKSVTVVTEGEAPKPKATKAKAEKQCCTAQTSKKEPCKFGALKGEVFCKRHLKQQTEEKQEVPKPVKPEPKKPAAKVEPVHTHPAGEPATEACDLCETHGDVLESDGEGEWEAAVESEGEGAAPVVDSEAESESDFDDE